MMEKDILEQLYLGKKMSAAEIATELKATFPTALYWIKKHRIPIRSCSERTYVKLNPGGDPSVHGTIHTLELLKKLNGCE